MRGKRSKQYRKLMHQYELSFNFRVPYQVLIDADMIKDTYRFKMNLPLFLERTLHGQVKPMITQCSIRHLYTSESPDAAAKTAWIDAAKSFERRRCNHHTLDEPLSTLECISSVVDPKSSGTNKNRYVVASQDQKVRSAMRRITGVPLIYVNRSVMIMEPMASQTEEYREAEEMGKVRAGLKSRRGAAAPASTTTAQETLKRKRPDDHDENTSETESHTQQQGASSTSTEAPKKRLRKGAKQPNPLSMKKPKKQQQQAPTKATQDEQEKQIIQRATKSDPQATEKALDASTALSTDPTVVTEGEGKKKRRRKHKSGVTGDGADAETTTAMELDA